VAGALLPVKLNSKDKRILILLNAYNDPISRRELHRLVKELQDAGVKFGFRFFGKTPFSQDLQDRLEKLVNKGYIFRLYMIGKKFYELYEDYYLITDKGRKVAEKMDVDKRDVKKILEYVPKIKPQSSSEEQAV